MPNYTPMSVFNYTTLNNTYTITGVITPQTSYILDPKVVNIQTAFLFNTTIQSIDLSYSGLTEIPSNAFNNCTNLSSVTFPTGLTAINSYAFTNCKLKVLNLSNTKITSLTDSFSGCPLETIDLSNTVNLTTMDAIFRNIITLTSVNFFGSGLTTIGNNEFYGCTNLSSVTFPTGLTTININSFTNCKLKVLNLSNTKITSFTNTFTGCPLETIDLSNTLNLTSMNDAIFLNYNTLTSVNFSGSGLTILSPYAFNNCTNLSSVTFPSGLTTISNSTFSGCTNLSSVTFPSTLTTIGNDAFLNCNLTHLNLSNTNIYSLITYSGDSIFKGCPLETINLSNTLNLTTIDETFMNIDTLTSVNLYGSGLTTLSPYAFNNCTNLSSVTLPSTLTTIGNSAFSGTNLSSFVVPATFTITNDNSIFDSCPLTTIYFLTTDNTFDFAIWNQITTATIAFLYNGLLAPTFTTVYYYDTLTSESSVTVGQNITLSWYTPPLHLQYKLGYNGILDTTFYSSSTDTVNVTITVPNVNTIELYSSSATFLSQIDTIQPPTILTQSMPIPTVIKTKEQLKILENYLKTIPANKFIKISILPNVFTKVDETILESSTTIYATSCPINTLYDLSKLPIDSKTIFLLPTTDNPVILSNNNVNVMLYSDGINSYINNTIFLIGNKIKIGNYIIQNVGTASTAIIVTPFIENVKNPARSIGMFRSGTTTLASATVSRDQSFSAKRAMVVQKVEQNRIAKVGVMDSSQRTSLRVASLGNLRTQFATRNGNDVKQALIRTRNAGSVAPKKKGASTGSTNSTIPYGGYA